LHVTLVVTSNTIPDCNKVEARLVKDVIVSSCNLKQTFCETVVEVLLLSSVVESRMTKVFRAISDEEFLKLRIISPRELLLQNYGLRVDRPPPFAKLIISHVRWRIINRGRC